MSVTFLPLYFSDSPRSPSVNSSLKNSLYCSMMGLSKPYCSNTCCRISSGSFSVIASMGFPGIMRTAKKAMVETTNSAITAYRIRFKIYFPIFYLFPADMERSPPA